MFERYVSKKDAISLLTGYSIGDEVVLLKEQKTNEGTLEKGTVMIVDYIDTPLNLDELSFTELDRYQAYPCDFSYRLSYKDKDDTHFVCCRSNCFAPLNDEMLSCNVPFEDLIKNKNKNFYSIEVKRAVAFACILLMLCIFLMVVFFKTSLYFFAVMSIPAELRTFGATLFAIIMLLVFAGISSSSGCTSSLQDFIMRPRLKKKGD